MTIFLIISLAILVLIRLFLIKYFFNFADIDKANHEVYLNAVVHNNNFIKNFIFDLEVDYPTLAHRLAHKIGFLKTQFLCEITLNCLMFVYLDATSYPGIFFYGLYLMSFPIFADLLQFNARTLGLIIILIHLPFITHENVLVYVASAVSLLVITVHISRFSFQTSLIFILTYFCTVDIKFLLLTLAISSIALLHKRTRLLFSGWYGHIFWSFHNQFELQVKKGYFRSFGEQIEKVNKRFILRRVLGRVRAIINNNFILGFFIVTSISSNASLVFLAIFILLGISPRLDRTIGEGDRYIKYALIFSLSDFTYNFSIQYVLNTPILFAFLAFWLCGTFVFFLNVYFFASALHERHTARSLLASKLNRHLRQIPVDMKICTIPLSLGNLIPEHRTAYPYTPKAAEFLSSYGFFPYFKPQSDVLEYFDYFVFSKTSKIDWVLLAIRDLGLKIVIEDESFIICGK